MLTDLEPMSYSRWAKYNRCPKSYELTYIEKVWRRPAAWLPQGTAWHAADEFWDRSGRTATLEQLEAEFDRVYVEEINQILAEVPNTEFWSRSGPYTADLDIPRRYGIGLEQVARIQPWYDKHPEEQSWVTPDGVLAVELPFDVMLGSVRVRGFIDDILVLEDTGLRRVRDGKSGNKPGEVEQLETYAAVDTVMHPDEEPIYDGDFWMAKFGKPTIPVEFDSGVVDRVTERFETLVDNIDRGDFPALPERDKCMFCDVNSSCPVWN